MCSVATYSMAARSKSSSQHTTQCYVSTYGRYLVVRLDVAMTMHSITHVLRGGYIYYCCGYPQVVSCISPLQ